jgi:uncharacterized Ntn-hydrolase superfamily protein
MAVSPRGADRAAHAASNVRQVAMVDARGRVAKAFRETKGVLASRMLAALEAAEAQSGDIRGRQAAALIVVSGTSSGRPWQDRKFNLRVDDHPAPLVELRRLVTLQRAYNLMNE